MIHERMKMLREDLGLSQSEFGEALGLNYDAVHNRENLRCKWHQLEVEYAHQKLTLWLSKRFEKQLSILSEYKFEVSKK